MLTSLHAQGSHTGCAVTLAAIGGEKGEPHGIWDTARTQRAPWKEEKQQAAITAHIPPPGLGLGQRTDQYCFVLSTKGRVDKSSRSQRYTTQEIQLIIQMIIRAAERTGQS